mmetsp:Transcript_45652/g.74149  ORF Transcript_45652/g.74149 Transcript_45652/m.74149 type:complete len:253 (-) Transcript_45652:477-1235(-)
MDLPSDEEEGSPRADPSDPKSKYLWKLGVAGQRQKEAVWQPREERPPTHTTLIIFDWDDTLLCTSAFNTDKPPTKQSLAALAVDAENLLSLAKTLGTVMIISNATSSWVHQSCRKYLPSLAKCIESVEIVSARDKFEKSFPDNPAQWKMEAFCEVKENSQTIANLVALGDSPAEMEALHVLAKLYRISYTKTIKFKERPTCKELRDELRLVQEKLQTITCAVKNYDIRLQRVLREGEGSPPPTPTGERPISP